MTKAVVRRLVDASAGYRKIILYLVPGKESFRKRLEQLCRYITRPARSDERAQLTAAGSVELKLKKPWHDGTMHLVISPMEFIPPLPMHSTVEDAPANDRFAADDFGNRMPGMGRLRVLVDLIAFPCSCRL